MSAHTLLGEPPPIQVTGSDFRRLRALTRSTYRKWDPEILEFLRVELDRATIIERPSAPRSFVGIGSYVIYQDETGFVDSGTLTLPGQEWDSVRAIPVLSALGAALLGLSENQSIAYQAPDGRTKRITLLKTR
ncbi:MAG TPA: GreA/GreB family elongation factor [Alphaproteobacteria bacterium]|nr:GreA/GreB family elongation factor [Alphaproteobacteria bacterium]